MSDQLIIDAAFFDLEAGTFHKAAGCASMATASGLPSD